MSEQMESFKFGEITKEEFVKIYAIRKTIIFATGFKEFFTSLSFAILAKKVPSIFGTESDRMAGFMPNPANFAPPLHRSMQMQCIFGTTTELLRNIDALEKVIEEDKLLQPYYQQEQNTANMVYETYVTTGLFSRLVEPQVPFTAPYFPMNGEVGAKPETKLGEINNPLHNLFSQMSPDEAK